MSAIIQAKPLDAVRYNPDPDALIEVTLRLKRTEVDKLDAFLESGEWERARAAREAKLQECVGSLEALLDTARRHVGTSGGRVCATLLASLYNGDRVKLDVSDLKRLDETLFEHALNTIRLCVQTSTEPHQFFDNGGVLFEQMIADWGLEKKRRARRG